MMNRRWIYSLFVFGVFAVAFFSIRQSALRRDEVPLDCYRSALYWFNRASSEVPGRITLFEDQEKTFQDLDFYPKTVARGAADLNLIVSTAVARKMISFFQACHDFFVLHSEKCPEDGIKPFHNRLLELASHAGTPIDFSRVSGSQIFKDVTLKQGACYSKPGWKSQDGVDFEK